MSPTNNKRLAYLDALKVMMTALVILHHTSITYGGSGSWYYKEPVDSTLAEGILTMFTAVNQSFFMGLFFFISGWTTPASYEKKGPARFLRDRLVRLGLPMLAYLLLIAPLLHYVSWGVGGSFVAYLQASVLERPWSLVTDPDLGPLWFVFALLLFNTGYTLYRISGIGGGNRSRDRSMEAPSQLTGRLIAKYLLITGAANFLVRLAVLVGEEVLSLQLAYFPAYIALFAAGAQASRNGWLEQLSDTAARKWRLTAVGLILLLPVIMMLGGAFDSGTGPFEGGFTWQSAFYSFEDPVLGLAISYVLLVRFRDRHNQESALIRWLSAGAFTVYVIHPLVVVYVSYAMKGLAWHPLLKFVVCGGLSLAGCWALAAFVRILLKVVRISHSIPSEVGR
jgi:glucans biosynthesis protein C